MADSKSEAGVQHFDIAVVGSGGGAKISTPAARLGYRVALVEQGFDVFGQHKTGLGGTCLNRGCIPSKMLIHAADVANEVRHAERFSVPSQINEVRFQELVERVSAEVDGDSTSINPRVEADPNRKWFKQAGRFIGPKKMQIGDEVITADYWFIAAGARPAIPPIPGLEGTPYWTSTEALRAPSLPKKLIVLGGGYIATELGHFYGGMGCEVHMMARSKLLRFEDSEVADEFGRIFSQRYNVHCGLSDMRVEFDAATHTFTFHYTQNNEAKQISGDQLMVVVGVVPNSDLLDLDKAGIATKRGNFIQVDECLRTTAPDVFALGDIAGNYLFRHSVNFEAEYLMEHFVLPLHAGEPINMPPIDYIGMPHAVFSNPQVAGVGETEDQLKQRGASYIKGINSFKASAMGSALRSEGGFVKLLIERGTRRILGCHIVGHEASTLIHQVIPLMRLQGKLDDLLYMIHIHPALNEIVRNAARKARDALVEAGEEIPVRLKLK